MLTNTTGMGNTEGVTKALGSGRMSVIAGDGKRAIEVSDTTIMTALHVILWMLFNVNIVS